MARGDLRVVVVADWDEDREECSYYALVQVKTLFGWKNSNTRGAPYKTDFMCLSLARTRLYPSFERARIAGCKLKERVERKVNHLSQGKKVIDCTTTSEIS